MDNNETLGRKIIVSIASFPIHFYQNAISPFTPASCRHIPTCSEYSLQALKKHGLVKGGAIAANRIGRCHPWGTQGWDPVPEIIVHVFIKTKDRCSRLKAKG